MEQLGDQNWFSVRQRFTAMVNRYEIRTLRGDGSLGEMLALPSKSAWH
jgi:hypothetical protein